MDMKRYMLISTCIFMEVGRRKTQLVIRKEVRELNLEEVGMKNTNKYQYFYFLK
jgi:hypothetical protein